MKGMDAVFSFRLLFAGAVSIVGMAGDAEAQTPARPASPPPANAAQTTGGDEARSVVAVVNGRQVTRLDLARHCLQYFGDPVLEQLVNQQLVREATIAAGVQITPAEIDAEIDETAERFNLSTTDFLGLIERERGVTREQYADEVVWLTLALRKLVGDKLTVTDQDVKEAWAARYGEGVRVRMISVASQHQAAEVLQQARAKPEDFPRLAREYSQDVNSASTGGLVQPIRHFRGEPEIEQIAFAMKEGQVSNPIPIGDQFIILKCEGRIPAAQVTLDEVRAQLDEQVREQKLPELAAELLQTLRTTARIENIFNDAGKRREHPGVAAFVNGRPVQMAALAEACIARHGRDVLDAEINRRLLLEHLSSMGRKVEPTDLQAEVARAAEANGKVDPQGRPDVAAWLKEVEKQPGVTRALYMQDAVWPSAALRKMVEDRVQVSEEDVNKGYEANYGPRARVRAIVVTSQRLAQQVWAMARENLSVEHFAKLAAEYSAEMSSRVQGGVVPPIQKHGGQPVLEEAAFALQPGEMSGVLQVADAYVILYCEGFTEPESVELTEVRELLHDDIYEKKMMLAMSEEFEKIKSAARVENFLAKTATNVEPVPPPKGQPLPPRTATPAVRPRR